MGAKQGKQASPVQKRVPKIHDNERWVKFTARTTSKQNREVTTNEFVRRILPGKPLLLGSSVHGDVSIMEASLDAMHAEVSLTGDGLSLTPIGRTYHLLGQAGTASSSHMLNASTVIKMGACSLGVTAVVKHTDRHHAFASIETEKDGAACYICFDGSGGSAGPLMDSPCSCGSAVHAACLRKWIASKGSRQCSICRNKLPIEFAAHPPYLVLQVVRHMRGLHWTGEREYVVGFGSAPLGGAAQAAASASGVHQWNPGYVENIVIGSGHECHLSLPDPSLSRRHACLSYDGQEFRIEDLHSSAGTYVRAMQPVRLQERRCEHFKMGRTTLAVDVLDDAPLMSSAAAARGGTTRTTQGSGSPFGGWGRGGSRRSTQVSPISSRVTSPTNRALHHGSSSATFVSGMASTSTAVSTIGTAGTAAAVTVRDTSVGSTSAASSFATLGRSLGSHPSIVTYQTSTRTGTGTNSTQADNRSFTVAHSSSLAYVTEH